MDMERQTLDDLRNADMFDSRDVIERIAELEAEEDDATDESGAEELETLRTFAEDASGYAADWEYGETFVRDSYFEDYARELAEDIGAVPDDAGWPCTCIDWEYAARELQMDYSSVELDGVTFWVR
jgi:antirestriction protein